jgi:diguanylate cyclase (GGDEF)-like protein/PAS domain S-box-containing protein
MKNTSKQGSPGHDYARLQRQHSVRHWFIIIVGLACVIGYAVHDYLSLWRRAEENLSSIARLADEHLARTVSETQLALTHVTDRLGQEGEPEFEKQANLRAILGQEIPQLAHLRSVSVTNTRGELVAASHRDIPAPVDVHDRDYFRNWLAETQPGIFIGVPVKPRVSVKHDGEWVLTFSLPILGRGGEFLGVALATVDPGYFARLYSAIDIDRRTQITVMRGDGILLARFPHVEDLMGKSVAHGPIFQEGLSRSDEGMLRYTSVVDNTDRLSAFRRLKDYPLVLVVGMSGSDIKRQWGERTFYVVLLTLIFLGILTRLHFRQRRQLEGAEAARAALEENEQRFRSLFDEAPVGHALNRRSDGHFLAINSAFAEITGYTREELNRLSYWDLTPERYADEEARQLHALDTNGRYGPYQKHYIRKDGSLVAVRLSGSLVTTPDGEKRIISVVEDISRYERAESRVKLLASVFEHSGEGFLITDHENRIIEINPSFTKLTGYRPEEVIGRNPKLLSSGRATPEQYREMWEAIRDKGVWQGEIWDRHKNGHIYPKWLTVSVVRDDQGRITHHIGSFTDITEHKAAEERIHYLAHHDALTQLPNRFNLHGRLEQALAAAERDHRQVAVMFIDMDRFKNINDSLGHHVGDALLVEVAQRLRDSTRHSDIVARLGGDEFVVVLTETEIAAIPALAGKIISRLGEAYFIAERELSSTPSIGISVYPEDGDSVEELMKNADTAMYHAKAMGRNNYQFFAASMNESAAEGLALESGLRRALEREEFLLHYQPQIEIASGRIIGFEALIRWQHPEMGLIPPFKFIPIAEETGLILPMGKWVVEEALRQLAAWDKLGVSGLRMAVNLSAHQLRDPTLQEFLVAELARHGLDGKRLELEITESVAMQHPERTTPVLDRLRELGIELAIDDFGTGYSSLAYLKKLPLDRLKLDRSFVMDIEHDSNDATISAATISLAHSLGLAVVAEGVETAAQLEFLRSLNCDFAQGYYFSKPLPAEECTALLVKAEAEVEA